MTLRRAATQPAPPGTGWADESCSPQEVSIRLGQAAVSTLPRSHAATGVRAESGPATRQWQGRGQASGTAAYPLRAHGEPAQQARALMATTPTAPTPTEPGRTQVIPGATRQALWQTIPTIG